MFMPRSAGQKPRPVHGQIKDLDQKSTATHSPDVADPFEANALKLQDCCDVAVAGEEASESIEDILSGTLDDD